MRSRISSGSFSSPTPRAEHGHILDHQRSRRRHRHQQPQQHGEQKSAEGADLQQEGMAGMEVADDAIRQQENHHGSRGQRHQPNIDAAMQPLPRVAEGALGQMGLVVAAHFRGKTGDVVAPPGQDLADDWVSAFCHGCKTDARAPWGGSAHKASYYSRTAASGSCWAANIRRLCSKLGCRPTHVPLSCAQFPDDYSAPKDAPG